MFNIMDRMKMGGGLTNPLDVLQARVSAIGDKYNVTKKDDEGNNVALNNLKSGKGMFGNKIVLPTTGILDTNAAANLNALRARTSDPFNSILGQTLGLDDATVLANQTAARQAALEAATNKRDTTISDITLNNTPKLPLNNPINTGRFFGVNNNNMTDEDISLFAPDKRFKPITSTLDALNTTTSDDDVSPTNKIKELKEKGRFGLFRN
tara:strand:+ start:244 stop:870 length:627 start_codon:yes stop_codon:yes gene_type:complete